MLIYLSECTKKQIFEFTRIIAEPLDSSALLQCRWIHCICCGADGLMEIVVVPMDSWSLLRCQWIHRNCCGTDRFTEIVAGPMESWKLLWCRWIHGNSCGANGLTEIVVVPMDSCALLQSRWIHGHWIQRLLNNAREFKDLLWKCLEKFRKFIGTAIMTVNPLALQQWPSIHLHHNNFYESISTTTIYVNPSAPQQIHVHCCRAHGFTVIGVVPMDSRSLLRCRWIHGHCCSNNGFTEIIVVLMDSRRLLWCRWIHVHCCWVHGLMVIVVVLMDWRSLL